MASAHHLQRRSHGGVITSASVSRAKKKTLLLFGNSLIFSPAPLVTVAGNDAKTCQRCLWSSQFLLAFPSILAPSNRGNPQNEKKKKTSGIFLGGPVEQKVVFRFHPILKWNENLTDQNGEFEQLPFDYEGSLTRSRIEFLKYGISELRMEVRVLISPQNADWRKRRERFLQPAKQLSELLRASARRAPRLLCARRRLT